MAWSSKRSRDVGDIIRALRSMNTAHRKSVAKELVKLRRYILALCEAFDRGAIREVSPEVFAEILDFMAVRNALSLSKMAKQFSIERSTGSRWRQGHNSPHPLVRRMVLGWLAQELVRSIRMFDPDGSVFLVEAGDASFDGIDPKEQSDLVTFPMFIKNCITNTNSLDCKEKTKTTHRNKLTKTK